MRFFGSRTDSEIQASLDSPRRGNDVKQRNTRRGAWQYALTRHSQVIPSEAEGPSPIRNPPKHTDSVRTTVLPLVWQTWASPVGRAELNAPR